MFIPPHQAGRWFIRLAIGLAWLTGSRLEASPRISEFLADNEAGPTDDDGANSDFIEIYNPDLQALSLEGYSLTDSAEERRKWIFPAVTLHRGEYLVVWASGKDRRDPSRPLHTNFALDKAGGYLALFNPVPGKNPAGPAPLSVFDPYPPQWPDRSFGVSQPVVTTPLVTEGSAVRWLPGLAEIPGWKEPGFDAGEWIVGQTGLGYDRVTSDGDFTPLIGDGGNTQAQMYVRTASCYLRAEFDLIDVSGVAGGSLRIRYDDGFVAYLNGQKIAERNAPADPDSQSAAVSSQDNEAALVPEVIDISASLEALQSGKNVLAIQGLNQSSGGVDFLLSPELDVVRFDPVIALTAGYFTRPTPGQINGETGAGFVDDPRFGAARGFYRAPATVSLASATPDALIRYTTDGSVPTLGRGTTYDGPLAISRTTVLRAAAFRDGWHPSKVTTQTMIFPADVVRQPATPVGYPSRWGTTQNSSGQVVPIRADYAMDQSVVNSPAYAGQFDTALSATLPVVALTLDKDAFFGASGPYADGREGSAELPVSVELFGPGLSGELQQEGGIRIHGGNARDHPKKPLRLYFKKQYGAGELKFPLFPGSPVDSFDQLILRPGGHDGWAVPFGNEPTILAPHASYVRDQFARQTELDLGQVSPRGRYVHLYINGLYWGLYDLHERSNAQFFAAHYGGREEEWDVLHHPAFLNENYAVLDGDGAAWDEVLRRADAGIATDAQFQELARLIDLPSYIDNLTIRIWAGDYDWCGPIFMRNGAEEAAVDYFDNKNWYCGRRSRGTPGRFYFHVWDAEMGMGTHLMGNLGVGGQPSWLSYPPRQDLTGFDSTRVGRPGSVAWPYAQLRKYEPFRRLFADRLQRNLFNGGALSTAANLARLDRLTAQIELPLIAESARWGDVNRSDPRNIALTRDTDWRPEIDWLRNTFMAGRNAEVLEQFRAIGLFPKPSAPRFVPLGDGTTGPFSLTIENPNAGGEIFYTLDGSDPSNYNSLVSKTLVDDASPCTWWVPTAAIGTSWRTPDGPSNPAAWRAGVSGIGFDAGGSYQAHFQTSVDALMRGLRTSAYLRIPFTLATQAEIDGLSALRLEVKYDDGFIAALNGTVVQRANAPAANESWLSAATTAHDNAAAVVFQGFDISSSKASLRVGANVLAFQGLNRSLSSGDFLLAPRLIGQTGGGYDPGPATRLYAPGQAIAVTAPTTIKARVRQDGAWSALTEAAFNVGVAASVENVVLSEFSYHPANPSPAEVSAGFTSDTAFEFVELLNIAPHAIDLINCRFTAGIAFDFTTASIHRLLPGERVVIAQNPAALTLRHGPGLPIAGAFADGSQLSNAGERLRLEAATGSVIFDFSYDDGEPWPTGADGDGWTAVAIQPATRPDLASPLQWRPSLLPGGTPGGSDTESYAAWARRFHLPSQRPLADPDADGIPNAMEYALGTDPQDPASRSGLTMALESIPGNPAGAQRVVLAFSRANAADDATLVTECSASLEAGSWRPFPSTPTVVDDAAGWRHVTLTGLDPIATAPWRYFRLRALVSP